jgi:uncharacterized lipoprotein YehR (DUF1307 family)|tara:strand:- start:77 stop:367 length:291 start_codon:yes stop_codon:yes gene_type:complete
MQASTMLQSMKHKGLLSNHKVIKQSPFSSSNLGIKFGTLGSANKCEGEKQLIPSQQNFNMFSQMRTKLSLSDDKRKDLKRDEMYKVGHIAAFARGN